ncbi:putative phage tail protein [Yersinia enterocolitica]|uniref:prophage tail fiber N-terminal domain-containing protein n=1 Tax=Yersinia enterocolitica TaxID=630 RepID=UPI0005DB2969|nr:prophage tail fiber N-terminal domain-containing protein [Yersinia enterocolitica]MDA5532882.1 prophage tail fiber N-terminal domain-containing protein [Yersinia enterocolitica]CQH06936.1 putative phage tail protein [Yersinia enterocolitica]HDL6944565.1 prophage tail fiber N-terminal domain-containing protein [Yersinia enterocolitica]HDL8753984.1 prophage tail fiber N-terminal domain-containing protein [Yersinia enterocolitica]
MSVTVSGIMINPVGEPVVNAQITLTAVANSLTVLNTFAATARTDNVGAYRLQLEEGSYSITVAVNGRSFVYGAVTLDNTTGPSTLNQLLKQQIMESELTPDVILYFRQIQQQVANDLATITVLESSATDAAESAAHYRDEAKQYAADLDTALAVAQSYRDESGVSAAAAAKSAIHAFESESVVIANANAAALSEANTLQYRNEAQSAADEASTLAVEQTATKIKLAVKTDADRAEAAREGAETAQLAVDTQVGEVNRLHTEVGQLASAAAGSANSAAQSASESESSKNAAAQSEQSALAGAEAAGNSATAAAGDKTVAKGFRDEAEQFAARAKASAESIDVSVLEQQINQKVSQTEFDKAIADKASNQDLTDGLAVKLDIKGGTLTGPLILAGDATDPKGAVTKQQLDAKPAGGLPLLHSYQTDTRDHIEAGEAPQDGQLLSRALFPDAWAAIQAKRTVITDAAWLGDPLKRGQFSSGDGSTTFRVPDKNGKYSGSLGATVGRGDGVKSAGTVGLLQMDAARNITGSFEFSPSTGLVLDISTLGGAFVKGTTNKAAGTNAQTIGAKDLLFDASKSPGFLVADENRVLSVTTCWVIKLAGAAFNEGQINALELATQITLLSTRIATLESHQKFTYLYPGGSAVAPATLGLSQRIVLDNPFIGRKIDYRCEVQFGGVWGVAGFGSNVGSGSVSVGALAIPWGDNIVVWSGNTWVAHVAAMTANSFPSASTITSAPYRVAVWTIDGLGA